MKLASHRCAQSSRQPQAQIESMSMKVMRGGVRGAAGAEKSRRAAGGRHADAHIPSEHAEGDAVHRRQRLPTPRGCAGTRRDVRHLMYPPGETSRELMQAADARKPMTLSWLRGWLTEESGKKFALPLTENRDPRLKIDGECVATWEFGNRKHEYIRTATDHVITREHDSANKLYVEHPNSELLELFCREQDIHVPAGGLTGANRALPPPQPRS